MRTSNKSRNETSSRGNIIEETPATADVPGASRTSNCSRDARNSRVVGNRRDAATVSNRRDTSKTADVPRSTRTTVAGTPGTAGLLAQMLGCEKQWTYQEHHGQTVTGTLEQHPVCKQETPPKADIPGA